MSILSRVRTTLFASRIAARAPMPVAVAMGARAALAEPSRPSVRVKVGGSRRDMAFNGGSSTIFNAASNSPHVPILTNATPSSLVSSNRRFRAWSRHLYSNDPWFKALIDRMCDRVIDTGPMPDTRSPVLKAWWPKVARRLDSRGGNSFGAWLRDDFYKTFLMDGEAFLRVVPLPHTGFDKDGYPTFGDDASPISFEVRSMTADFVPEYMYEGDGSFQGAPAYTHYGIMLRTSNLDKRLGYWVYDHHPFDVPSFMGNNYVATQVPASQVAHLKVSATPGSVRGENRWTSIFIRSNRLNDYEDAEIRRKQLNCAMSVIIEESAENVGDAFFPGEVDENGLEYAGENGEVREGAGPQSWGQMELVPGGMMKVPKGMTAKVNDPKPTPSGDDWWTRFQILAMCACTGLPDYEVTQDYSNVKSDRVIKIATKNSKSKYRLERGYVESMGCNWLWNLVVKDLAMTGRFVAPAGETFEDYFDEPWDWPVIEDAQTNQDVAADIAAIDAKLINRDHVVRERNGKDPEEVARKIAYEAARDAAYGFNQTPVAVLKTGGSVVPFWSPSTPLAQKMLADVDGSDANADFPTMTPIPGDTQADATATQTGADA